MEIEFFENGKVFFLMKDYIKESIAIFEEILDETVSSTAKKGLQNVNKE